ncbi:Germin-like protein 9-3 [Vitis vinifera]|uniref:Germin-like protein 9-3 n=1 Tax=Vitis vinifera TaxID=29760 RepID=A0A438HQJ9_VITVI|nr:Germin-like protein 9-3 [Vitis vinifera]
MASRVISLLFSLLGASFAIVQIAIAGDPDIVSDFIIPPNMSAVDGNFFTFTGIRALVGAPEPTTFKVTKASLAEFPALNGQSVSTAVLEFPADSVNPPHTHPRSAELLFLLDGSLQYNVDAKNSAVAFSAFGSANAGTVSLPNTVFATGIDDNILAKSFKTDVATIQAIKAGLAPKP